MIRSQKHQKSKNIESIYALSPMQEGLLFHTLYAPNSGVYIEQILLTFSGQMNAEIFKQSWQQLLQRHGALRTLFLWEGRQQPLQVVKKQVDLPWSYLDWQNISPMEQQQKLEAFLKRNRNQGFQLNKAPLMRCTLIRLANQTYKLIWTLHHILIDGWCFPIILKEVTSYYQSSNQGQRCNLLPVRPYKDYIIWLQQQDLEGAEGFWRKTLQGFTTPTPLVVEKRQQQELQHLPSYQYQQLTLGGTTANALKSFARQYRLTTNVLVQAAWALLLNRYSGDSDVLFGVTVSGRQANLSGVEKMVGLFINTLPLGVKVTSKAKLIPWLQQLKQKQLQLQEYSYSSLTKIKLLSEIPGRLPLFESILAFENYPFEESLLQINPDLQIVDSDSFSQTNYPLALLARVTTEDFILRISYDTSRFAADTIARMLRHLQTSLEGMVANPNIELGRLPLLTDEEQQQLLVEWNNTKTDYPKDKCIHQLFEEQVEKNPEAVAVVFEEQKLTYCQLNSKANQLAHHLQTLGVKPETLVGICVERSVEMVVGILAILKAGGTYIPLETNNLQDWPSIAVILTQNHLKSKIPNSSAQILCLDTEWESIAKQNTDNPNRTTTATNLAYILNHTLVEHQAVVQRLQWLQEILNLTNQDILLHKTCLSQEVAILEIGLPLISGGSVVIAANSEPKELQKLISQHKVTIVHLYPSELSSWLNQTNSVTSLNSWGTLLCSGETLSTEIANKFLQSYPVSLHNFYSLPEAAGEITHWYWSEKPTRENVPIGNPGRLSVYLLDQHKNPVPKGVPGEIYVGGSSLARGALQQQKTQEFIQHPQLGRLFPTGDIGREHNKGYLEIVGAQQRYTWVKGQRVQLADIEKALLSAPGVEEAYVLAHQTLLVAYVVVAGVWNPQQLNSQMQQQLPPWMMPGAYVPLSSLPLTHKGKVDEVALGRFPVIDDNVVQRWEAKLKAVPEIEEVAVVVQQKKLKLPPLHISDLLPSAQMKLPNHGATPVVEKSSPTTELQSQSKSGKQAISEGGPIKWPANAPTTLAQALERAAQEHGETSLRYIHSDGEVSTQTYSELWVEAQRILGGLRELGLKPQAQVIFQLESNQDFISAFWGCVLGGFVPVPVSIPPSYDQSNSGLTKLQNTWGLLGQPLVLTDRKLAPSVSGWSQRLNLGKFELQTIEKLRSSEIDRNWYNSQPEDVAMLLLTSGSTGIPKAVMQSHRSLLSRSAATAQMNDFSCEEISLNWFPLDHVGGIVMFQIRDVYLGCQQIHVPTQEILQTPTRWLDLMSQYRTTITWAPNFAYGLIIDQLEQQDKIGSENPQWDLSSLKFILNGGEAIVGKTARKFGELLSRYHLPPQAMHPAWGMSETSSAVTFSNKFWLDSTDNGQKFVEVGSPIPGFAIRIVDNQNQIVSEEIIGRVQVKGPSVTSGYYQNPTANQEAFTADGWFNTGDLGFLKNGCLTITGRQKDVIIINGLNYYSHEMESVVEELPEIEVSYTAACALRETNSNTDKLGIFFNSSKTEDTELLGLLKTLREQIVNRMGINPDYLIPLDKDLIPKTSIGKIQRTQLSQRFAKGEFQEVLKRVDLITENSNTIPDWFYEKTWQRKQGNYQPQKLAKIGVFLVFIDKLGLGQKFCQKLENNSQAYVQIELGETFKKINENYYIIGPDVQEDYQQLYQDLGAENLQIGAIIHLWHYDKYTGEITDTETLERAQKTGIYSLLFILQTFGNQKENEPVRLLYVASQSQSLEAKELMAYEKATVPGLLKTIPQENPEWDCRHLDLPQESLEVNSNRILEELTIDAKDSEVAYRDGERWVSGIKKINLPSLPLQPLPFKAGGIYLISGGLGGIGVEIAKYLLENYQAKLLLLGRTPLPERNSWEIYLQQGGKLAEKIKTYQQLQKLGGEVIYQGVDIGHQKAVQDVVQQTLSGWDVQQLDGVIHLAGSYHESLLKDETKQSLATLLNPKVQGAWILYQLVQKQPSTLFLNFSSAIGVFGGVIVGAYASSNSFLENLTYYQRYQGGLHSYCFAWTTWSKTGMSKGYQMKYITRSQGYSDMSISQGMSSMLAGLCRNQPQLIVGLDGSNINIRRFTSTSDSLQQLTAYFTINGKGKPNVSVMDLPVQDAVGKPSSCSVVELPEMPLTKDGDIDIGLLSESNLGRSTQEIVKPGNDTEKKITTIWKEVLQTEKVGIYDNFFELGGKSVLLIQVYGKLQKIFDINLKVVDLLANPTVHSLSEFIINGGAAELNKQSQITHEKRVSKRLSKKSERGNIRKKLRTI